MHAAGKATQGTKPLCVKHDGFTLKKNGVTIREIAAADVVGNAPARGEGLGKAGNGA